MTASISIRHMAQPDIPAVNDIYNHYIENTAITFDIEPKTLDDREAWFAQFFDRGRHQCLVALDGEEFRGWACSGPFRPKAAYSTSVETSIYLAPDAGGQGIGTLLYDALFASLARQDVHMALAGITQPNDASNALHRGFGFKDVGTFRQVGRKFDKYWDVLWMEKTF